MAEDRQLELTRSFHSISIHPDNINSYYAMDIVEKFQELGKFFDECIQCIDGPYGLLKKSNQIKLGDKIVGNNDKVDLHVLLGILKEIHRYVYQGIKYVSRLAALKQKIEKMKTGEVWNTELRKFEFKNVEFSSILKKVISKYGCMSACGSLAGGSIGLLSVGAVLGVIFGAALFSVSSIFSLFGAVIGVTALGVCAGVFGFWFYQAVKVGNERSSTFDKFQELELKLEKTKFRVNLKDMVLTIQHYCGGVMDIVIDRSIRSRSESTNDTPAISHVKPSENDLLREYMDCYKRKLLEFEENTPDISEENRRLIALNVVIDKCKDKLRDLGYSEEKVNQFINQSLMPEIRDMAEASI